MHSERQIQIIVLALKGDSDNNTQVKSGNTK